MANLLKIDTFSILLGRVELLFYSVICIFFVKKVEKNIIYYRSTKLIHFTPNLYFIYIFKNTTIITTFNLVP